MKTSTLILLPFFATGLHAQNPDPSGRDPFADDSHGATHASVEEVPFEENLSLCYEVFSLPLDEAAHHRREQIDDAGLYELLSRRDGKQEVFSVVRLRPGRRASSEAILETIYPTEWEPAELPNTVGVGVAIHSGKESSELPSPRELADAPPVASIEGLRTGTTATSFETRNTGVTIEMESGAPTAEGEILMNFSCEQVTLVGYTSFGKDVSEVTMPEFESQKLQGEFKMTLNRPFLLGTLNQPPHSKVDPDSANKVWFAFITVTKVRR